MKQRTSGQCPGSGRGPPPPQLVLRHGGSSGSQQPPEWGSLVSAAWCGGSHPGAGPSSAGRLRSRPRPFWSQVHPEAGWRVGGARGFRGARAGVPDRRQQLPGWHSSMLHCPPPPPPPVCDLPCPSHVSPRGQSPGPRPRRQPRCPARGAEQSRLPGPRHGHTRGTAGPAHRLCLGSTPGARPEEPPAPRL